MQGLLQSEEAILLGKLRNELAIGSAEEVSRAPDLGALEEINDEESKASEDSIG